jgi:hypothetical protein
VSTQRVPERASCEARQSEGCKASGAIGGSAKGEAPAVGEQFIWVGKKVLYKRTVLAEPGFGKMYSFRPYQLSDWYWQKLKVHPASKTAPGWRIMK